MTFFQKWCAVLALSFLTGATLNAILPKNDFRETITQLVEESHGQKKEATNLEDRFFTEIFYEAVPTDTAIIRLNDGNCKDLCDFVRTTSADMGIPTPSLYLATDTVHVDAKFATHNEKAGILLHSRLFSVFNTLNLKHYLRNSVLKRLRDVYRQHQEAVESRDTKQTINGLIPVALVALLLMWLKSGKVTPWGEDSDPNKLSGKGNTLLGLGAAIVAAGGAARFMHLLKRTLSTHAYEQVSSHENSEFGREDVFPGPSEGRVEATYDASPDHLMDVMLRIKSHIRAENRKYAELRRLEIEEEEEQARKMAQ